MSRIERRDLLKLSPAALAMLSAPSGHQSCHRSRRLPLLQDFAQERCAFFLAHCCHGFNCCVRVTRRDRHPHPFKWRRPRCGRNNAINRAV